MAKTKAVTKQREHTKAVPKAEQQPESGGKQARPILTLLTPKTVFRSPVAYRSTAGTTDHKPTGDTMRRSRLAASLQRFYGNARLSCLLGGGVEAKLKVSGPNDQYEQEADRIASTMTETLGKRVRLGISWESTYSTRLVQHGATTNGTEIGLDMEKKIQQARSGGHTLPESTRQPIEQSFGSDFRGVHVHTDANADRVSQDLNARAFTRGRDIFFRQGEYDPENSSGQKLIAHELTHVVQQTSAAPTPLIQREQFGTGILFDSLPGCPPQARVLTPGVDDAAIAEELYEDPGQAILYLDDDVIAILPQIRDEWQDCFDFALCEEEFYGPGIAEPDVTDLIQRLVDYEILNPRGNTRQFNNILHRHVTAHPRTTIGNDYISFLRNAYPMRGFAITYRGQHWNALYDEIRDFYGVPRLPRYLSMTSALGGVRQQDIRNFHMYDESAYDIGAGYVIPVGGSARLSASTLRRVRPGTVIRGYPIEGTLLLMATDRFLSTLSLTATRVTGTTVPAASAGAVAQWSVGSAVRSQEIGGVVHSVCPLTSCAIPTQQHVFGDPNRFDDLIVYWTNHFNEIFLPVDSSGSPNPLDPNLVKTIIYKETQFHPRAEDMRRRPGGGGRGLTQITPPTGQVVAEERPDLGQFAAGVREIMHGGRFSSGDPAVQIAAGIRVLFQKYQRAGSWRGAVALYPDPAGAAGYTRVVSRVYECRTTHTL